MAARLTVEEVSLSFGGISVLDKVSFEVEPGMIFGLVGPNGAGKTSLFNCISGHYRPTSGAIRIDDVDVLSRAPHSLARVGLSRTFQHAALQPHRTVLDNVMVGAHSRMPGGPFAWSFKLPYTGRAERRMRDKARALLEQSGLGWAADSRVDELSYGLYKGVELCRALSSGPSLLLLDEPAAGLSHAEVDQFIAIIRGLRTELDLTIVIVEHNMGLISALTDRVVVLDHGSKLVEGTAAEAQSDPRVIEAYLGSEVVDGESADG